MALERAILNPIIERWQRRMKAQKLMLLRNRSNVPEFVLGIDLDHHQEDVDWIKLKNTKLDYNWSDAGGGVNWQEVIDFGIKCVIVGISEGYGDTDPNYKSNYLNAHINGFVTTGYHFAYPSKEPMDAWKEARYFLGKLGELPKPHVPICLDLEQNEADMTREAYTSWAETFVGLGKLVSPTGIMLYGSDELDNWLQADHKLGKIPLFLPRYGKNDGVPRIDKYPPEENMPKGWDDWNIWQFTSNGRVPGIDKRCDMFLVRRDWLLNFVSPSFLNK